MISDAHKTYWAAPPQRDDNLIPDRWPSYSVAIKMQQYTILFGIDSIHLRPVHALTIAAPPPLGDASTTKRKTNLHTFVCEMFAPVIRLPEPSLRAAIASRWCSPRSHKRKRYMGTVHRTVSTMTLESGPSVGPGPEGQQNARQRARQKIMCNDKKYFVVHKNTQFALRNDRFDFLSAFCRAQFVDFCRRPPNDVSCCLSAFLLANCLPQNVAHAFGNDPHAD